MFFPPKPSRRALGVYPSSSYPVRNPGLFRGVKRPGHEVDHHPPSTIQVENEWGNTSGLLICLYDVYRDYWDYRTFSPISETTWSADIRTEGLRLLFVTVIRAELVPELSN